ncbi:MAG: class adenine-specific methyltransferase [Paenibacillus sp.]|jgi:DNA adenine methylase|nr:class adenine-specific methyltransferase [Paenibacillus sp.]
MAIAERLQGVQVETQPALKLIQRYKIPSVLIYADPPYLLSTRNKRIYRHEMNDNDHIELLDALDAHPGPVILSGYDHQMYNTRLSHWHKEERQALAEAGQIKTEVLWINEMAAGTVGGQMKLF